MTKDKVKQIIIKNLNPDIEIEDNTSLRNDLCIDSLDLMSLVSSFEQEFKIVINITEVENIDTLQEITEYIEGKKDESM